MPVSMTRRGLHLLGVVSEGERSAWQAIAGRGPVDAAEAAAAAGCAPEDAARLLDALARRRLVMPIDGGYMVLEGAP